MRALTAALVGNRLNVLLAAVPICWIVAATEPGSPWIFITAHDDQLVREQAERACAAYLVKPFEGRALLALIARVMGS